MQEIYSPEISGLEQQIDLLIRALEKLKSENTQLRNQLSQSARQRAVLMEKNQKAARKVKKVISQIKEELA